MPRMKDLTGKRFGKLTAIEPNGKNKYGNYLWLCRCDCGNEIIALSGNLLKGNTKSCGCTQENDLTGNRYGKLLVVKRMSAAKHGDTVYICKCDCGNEITARQSNLVKGHHTSCGKLGCKKTNLTHGMRQTDIYKKYYDIHTRCNDKNNPLYGGRGISVCEKWSGPSGFLSFMEWSMANGYEEGLSLDRINVNGDYCPENCRWTDMETQARNKRLLPSNKTGYAGVYIKNGKYAAQISVDKKHMHLGTFQTIEEAAKARRDAELKYWGWTKIHLND